MNMASTRRALENATKNNMASIIQQVKEQTMEIENIKVELELSKKLTITLVIETLSFNSFIGYA